MVINFDKVNENQIQIIFYFLKRQNFDPCVPFLRVVRNKSLNC